MIGATVLSYPSGGAGGAESPPKGSHVGARDPLVGNILGSCQLVERLGAGAMGIVYRARHLIHGDVCVKIVRNEHKGDVEMVRRFRREAEAARRIEHPHVVRGFGLEEVADHLLMVQEYVSGGDLAGHIHGHGGRLPVPEALRIAREIALGLAAAHGLGLVHRDLKPVNILLDGETRAKIADFGFVLQVGDAQPLDGRTVLTAQGDALGTPLYMAPETWEGSHEVDAQADLYALGVMTFEMLTGRPPFIANNLRDIMRGHLFDEPPFLVDLLPDVPHEVDELVRALLAKKPEDRPSGADAVAAQLDRVARPIVERSAVETAMYDGGEPVSPAGIAPSPLPPPPSDDSSQPLDDESAKRLLSMAASGGVAEVPPVDVGSFAAVPDEAEVAAAKADPRRSFGRYVLLSELGRGGMGVVYRAYDDKLGRVVALKVVLVEPDETSRERFRREARAAARLRHEHILTVYEYGEEHGRPYFVMEFLEGDTLGPWVLASEPLIPDVVGAIRDIAHALAYAHDEGVIHRDVKPGNILIAPGPRSYLMDFGLAQDSQGGHSLTTTGRVMGTPRYMAPEQIDEAIDQVGAATDIYALGAVLYEALTLAPVFQARSNAALFKKILFDDPEAPRSHNPHIPETLERIVLRSLQKQVADRHESAAALADDLTAFLEGRNPFAGAGSPPAPAREPAPPLPSTAPPAPLASLAPRAEAVLPPRVAGSALADQESSAVELVEELEPRRRTTTSRRAARVVRRTTSRRLATARASSGEHPGISEGLGALTANGPIRWVAAAGVVGLILFAVLGRGSTPATVEMTSPGDGQLFGRRAIAATGRVTAGSPEELWVGGIRTAVDAEGRFSQALDLADGEHEILVEERLGAAPAAKIRVTVDTAAPELAITSPADGTLVAGKTVRVEATVSDRNLEAAGVRGGATATPTRGKLGVEVPLPDTDGDHAIELWARDRAGHETSARVTVRVDRTAPVLEVDAPRRGETLTRKDSIDVVGRVSDPSGVARLAIDGKEIEADEDGEFRRRVPLADGKNEVSIFAADAAGNESRIVATVVRDARAPEIVFDHLPGYVEGPAVVVVVRVDADVASVEINGVAAERRGETFRAEVPLTPGENRVVALARDAAGNSGRIAATVVFEESKPDGGITGPPGTWWGPIPKQLAAAKKSGRAIWFENALGMRFVVIPPGRFRMGTPGRVEERAHTVTLTRTFWIGAFEVSNAQFREFRGDHDSGKYFRLSLDGDDQPATQVSWDDAVAFCRWLTKRDARWRYRLPTEAEWEYVVRAGTDATYPWGDATQEATLFANVADEATKAELADSGRWTLQCFPGDDRHRTSAPGDGGFSPSSLGVYHMIGNVWEWCADLHGPYPVGEVTDPKGADESTDRVLRGGCWRSTPREARCAFRYQAEPDQFEDTFGFRVVAVPKGD